MSKTLKVDPLTGSITLDNHNVDPSRGSFYLQGAVELLNQEGEWAVRNGVLYFWPFSLQGIPRSPNDLTITAPAVQRVFSFVGSSSDAPAFGITLQGLEVIGAAMPYTYTYACGAWCAANGGPDTPGETNTSPLSASQGMLYMENASNIEVVDCKLRAGGIAAIWLQEFNLNHTIKGNWIQEFGGFGLYANGVGIGDRRYRSPVEADCNKGHTIHNNLITDGGRQIVYGTGVWFFQAGESRVTHNVIHRFPRDAVGFYGELPFWTADPGGPVAPSTPVASEGSSERFPWGRFITWNGGVGNDGNATWSTWEVLFVRNMHLAWNDVSNCNREGLDGGVIESWGASNNNTWEYNAVHDNEGYAGLSLMFADDFSPNMTMNSNIIYENNCPILSGNCAVFMIKSVNMSIHDNTVADQNYSRVFEISPYRMPAANIQVSRTILWNTTQRIASEVGNAYTDMCTSNGFGVNATAQNATLGALLDQGDGTSGQRTRAAQYGFSAEQLQWPVVTGCDHNYASNLNYLKAAACNKWDQNSIQLEVRPFTPVSAGGASPVRTSDGEVLQNTSSRRTPQQPAKMAADDGVAPTQQPYYLRTYRDYAIDPASDLVTKHGFKGVFDVNAIGLTADFTWNNHSAGLVFR
jgi:hypothetical protein